MLRSNIFHGESNPGSYALKQKMSEIILGLDHFLQSTDAMKRVGLQITDLGLLFDGSLYLGGILALQRSLHKQCTTKDLTGGALVRPSGERMRICRAKAKYSMVLWYE